MSRFSLRLLVAGAAGYAGVMLLEIARLVLR